VAEEPSVADRRTEAEATEGVVAQEGVRAAAGNVPATKRLDWGWIRKPVVWLALAVVAAAIGVPVTNVVNTIGDDDGAKTATGRTSVPVKKARTPADPFFGGMRSVSGSGPARPVFRCAKPSECDGPHYVVFNSYINNPVIGNEQWFLAAKDLSLPKEAHVVDTVEVTNSTRQVMLRVAIDNDTFQTKAGVARDTRLRVALPKGVVYSARPTAYLRSVNAKPQTVWDTAGLRSSRPFKVAYVPGSSLLSRHGKETHLPDGIATSSGLNLGMWDADFVNAGYVTFKIRVQQLAEPVRDPKAAFVPVAGAKSPPPSRTGAGREPVVDGTAGDRFSCESARCQGPPYPELNAYENHPVLGDEADFIRGALASGYATDGFNTYRSVAVVEPGDELHVRIAIDNGGDPQAIGAPAIRDLVARRVRAQIWVPPGSGKDLAIRATLRSTTTEPAEVTDLLPVRASSPIRLVATPKLAEVISAGRAYTASSKLFAIAKNPEKLGAPLGDIEPSFSKVLYLLFTVKVVAG
jgi:hypothetical protein